MHLRNREVGGKKIASRRSRPEQKYRVQQLRPKAKASRLFFPRAHRQTSPEAPLEGDGAAPLETNWGDPVPEPAAQQGPPAPTVDWYSDATSHAPEIPPLNPTSYRETEQVWSYEVETNTQIFRISTVPNDFLGNSKEDDWPRVLKTCHDDYKAVQAVLLKAQSDLVRECSRGVIEPHEVISLQKAIYRGAYDEAQARADFLKVWPSAFGSVETGFDGHLFWSRKLETTARVAQEVALNAYRELYNREPKEQDWLTENVDDWKFKPTHALSPVQYKELYETVTRRKEYERDKTRTDWEKRVQPARTIELPNLPPLRPGLTFVAVPEYSRKTKEEYRLPIHIFRRAFEKHYDGI